MKFSKKILCVLATCLFTAGSTVSCSNPKIVKKGLRYKYKDLIDVSGVPYKAKPDTNYEINPFSDMGAWHAYHLPKIEDKDYYGGFTGPLFIAQEYGLWLSKCFSRMKIYDEQGNEMKLSDCSNAELSYYPGLLVQNYELDKLNLRLELRFVSSRTALVTSKIKNLSEKPISLRLGWDGDLLKYTMDEKKETLDTYLSATQNGIKVNFLDVNWTWDAFTSSEMEYEVRYPFNVNARVTEDKYTIELMNSINISPGSEYVLNTANTYTFTGVEKERENKIIQDIFDNYKSFIEDNEDRWNNYIYSATDGVSTLYDKAAVKAVETMVTNWRSPAGAIKRNGITPSMSYTWFNGLWAWDSWKHSAAAADFAPELAKDGIRAMFDYQRQDGMIIDSVFYNKSMLNYTSEKGGNWNERNSKPPLAGWAVWKVYEKTGDRAFLEEMYPKLVKYHNWWYACRDNDKNGIAEYGAAVDGLNRTLEDVIQAAAWESGMDNAVRFDADYGVEALENSGEDGNVCGYSISQESVDLNSYLYAEKLYLSKIASMLNKKEDSARYDKEAEFVGNYIREHMYDSEKGFFYDIDIYTKKPLSERGKGTEGFMPLWAGIASKEQSKAVRNCIMDEKKFNTRLPIPTASRDNERYAPAKYWRGPVWLDQAYFAVEGLHRYGYDSDAKALVMKILNNAEGILEDGQPFRENYNPEDGTGLNCTNFSWSAGMVYLMCKNYLD